MALASQSSRPDRPFRSTRSGRSLVGARGIVALCAAGAAFGGSWWLMRSDSGVEGALAPKTSGTVLAAAGTSGLAAIPPELTATPIAPQPSALDNALADAANAARAESQLSRAEAQAPPVAEPASPQGVPASVPANAPAAAPATSPTSPTSPVGNGFDGKPLEARPQGASPSATNAGGIAEGLALAATDPVKGRRALSEALLSGALSQMESKQASDALNKIAAQLVFTPVYNASDPYFFQYTVQAGDSLEKIVRRHKIGCDWRLVARINNIKRPEAIRVGQRLKLPKGPFSAVVTKRDYRVDLVMGAGSDRVVMASIPCGLGSANGTPTGRFRVRPGSKLLNPEWTHPVTGQHFKSDDPMNPIGEHWLGLEGIEATNSSLAGYGIHGTIEPESIGRDMSLGCVRLIADDVAIVWETLGDGCEVEIR
jgi:nucleoid-associated protein YgaU